MTHGHARYASAWRAVPQRGLTIILLIGLLLLSANAARGSTILTGTVESASMPIVGAAVTLYQAGHVKGAPATVLGASTTDDLGNFQIPYASPGGTPVLYVIAEGGSPSGLSGAGGASVKLAAVLGQASNAPVSVVVNELTTVGSVWAMAQFMDGSHIAGNSPGLQNAAATAANLVDVTTGVPGAVLANPPNGSETSTLATFNTLGNLLASCVDATDPHACHALFSLSHPPTQAPAPDTLQAALNIAHNPGLHTAELFWLAAVTPVYAPSLSIPPDAWTIALTYVGNGAEFDGPGNMAVDQDGNIWITNNYEFASDPFVPVCGSKLLSKLTPTGADAPGAPFTGGGLDGAGFGIAIDLTGNVWVSNFGFAGQGCSTPPLANSVSEFASAGMPLSPADGFTQGPIYRPQGTAVDQAGNVWIVNSGSDSVTQFVAGDPNKANHFQSIGAKRPFGAAIDAAGNLWATSSGNDRVIELDTNGHPVAGSPFSGGGLRRPLGIAIDSLGNVWVANNGDDSLTALEPNGAPWPRSPFSGGGLDLPWGIAVDGADNIWVTNFTGRRGRISAFCGARTSNCPLGLRTGDPISPRAGYTSDALERNTGIVIDTAGNVWVVNNWRKIPVQTNPGGHSVVEFIGLAAPVKTPLLGPPQQP